MALYVGHRKYDTYVGSHKVMFALKSEEPLPYDAEVEYLKSDGRPYIDSGIETAGDLSIQCRVMINEDKNSAFCGGIANNPGGGYFRHHGNIYNYAVYYLQANSDTQANLYYSSSPSINKWYDIVVNADGISGTLNGSALTVRDSSPLSSSLHMGTNFGIFARISPIVAVQSTKCQIAYFKILRGGVLLRDFIPVRVGTTGYLYDKVSKQLFGNQGSGSFVVGPDKN